MTAEDGTDLDSLETLRFVGPVTAAILEDAGIDAAMIRDKRVSYSRLVKLGVNPGVAAKLRREHSLPWTAGGLDPDLNARSRSVRGLRQGERQWVAQSATTEWTTTRGESYTVEQQPRKSREQGYGTTIDLATSTGDIESPTVLDGIDDPEADRLSDAGIKTVRQLTIVNEDALAEALDIDQAVVQRWKTQAQSRQR